MTDDELRDAGAAGWLSKADDDLRVAEVILSGEIGVEWAACFHAQQAAEKALKGVLVHLGIDFPKSHSLDRLVALMPSNVAERFELDALIELTPWAVAGRYPEDIENPTSAQAARVTPAQDHFRVPTFLAPQAEDAPIHCDVVTRVAQS